MSYLDKAAPSSTETPQSEPIPGTDQVENSAGGFVWEVDNWTKLSRFLILGTESGSYYASERKMTADSLTAVRACIAEDPARVVTEIVKISDEGRAVKQDPGIYVLAMVASCEDEDARADALAAMPSVCRTGYTLFMFCEFIDKMRGWGPALRKAVGAWYTEKSEDQLAYQMVKYRQRNGWTHRDVLRLARIKDGSDILGFATGNTLHERVPDERYGTDVKVREWAPTEATPRIITGHLEAMKSESPEWTGKLIRDYGLPREAVNTDHLKSREVWNSLLHSGGTHGMPTGAMVRNLANMTRCGLLTPGSEATKEVIRRLGDEHVIKQARIHPVQVLFAMDAYAQGGDAGRSRGEPFTPVPQIVDALDAAFYTAFGNVEPTNARTMLAFDVSPSMGSYGYLGSATGLTPRKGAAAMGLITANVEEAYLTVMFAGTERNSWMSRSKRDPQDMSGIQPFALSSRQRLDDVVRQMEAEANKYVATDCSLPMLYALKNGLEIDAFFVYTDSETWFGVMHPTQALATYRKATGIPAKLVVVGMVANEFSIADPNDRGMMDVVGFDTNAPNVMSSFVRGQI